MQLQTQAADRHQSACAAGSSIQCTVAGRMNKRYSSRYVCSSTIWKRSGMHLVKKRAMCFLFILLLRRVRDQVLVTSWEQPSIYLSTHNGKKYASRAHSRLEFN
eukprot:5021356-Amphidinium_carterae.1